jgi:hypothetical protein
MGALTAAEAQEAFNAVAALGDRIAFRYIAEGCESRAQLMIEHLEVLGIDPGRAWALMVGRPLRVENPLAPKTYFKWLNHTAPTVAVEAAPQGVLVIDPSLSRAGPATLPDWAGLMRARSVVISEAPLSQAAILEMQRVRVLAGQETDAILFSLKRGLAPIPERGGSGFRIDVDPPEGVSVFAHTEMQRLLAEERKLPPSTP